MRGEIDFKQSLVQRVGCLRGHRAESMYTEVMKCITFTPGAEELCATLKARGYAPLGPVAGASDPTLPHPPPCVVRCRNPC